MSKTKIIILGAGLIGQEHAKLLQEHPQAILVGIADVTDDADKYARSLNVPFYRDYEKLLYKKNLWSHCCHSQQTARPYGACMSR